MNPLQVDCRSTILSYYTKIHLNRDAIISAEAEFLRNANIKLILVDATPLAGSIGDFVGIKTILISNFLWSYCYEGMYKILKENGEAALMSDTLSMDDAEMMIEACKKDYDRVSMLLQLPGSCPLHDSFPLEKIFKGPVRNEPITIYNAIFPSTQALTITLLIARPPVKQIESATGQGAVKDRRISKTDLARFWWTHKQRLEPQRRFSSSRLRMYGCCGPYGGFTSK